MAQLLLSSSFVSKSRQILRIPVVTAIAFALLYYSIAWVVLRCPHQENQTGEIGFLDPGSYAAEIVPLAQEPRQANIECTGPAYETESLAGSTTLPELVRLSRGIASEAKVLLPLPRIVDDTVGDLWLRILFQGASPPFLFDIPRYLSLSVLRV